MDRMSGLCTSVELEGKMFDKYLNGAWLCLPQSQEMTQYIMLVDASEKDNDLSCEMTTIQIFHASIKITDWTHFLPTAREMLNNILRYQNISKCGSYMPFHDVILIL